MLRNRALLKRSFAHSVTELADSLHSALTIVIPVFNEEASIPTLIDACSEVEHENRIEFLIVENGSSDGSLDVLEEILAGRDNFGVLPVRPNCGFGGGISHGIAASTTDFVAWIPGNLKVHPKSCAEGFSRILASEHYPNVAAKARRTGRPLYDKTATMLVSVLWSLMTRRVLWDTGAPPTIVPRRIVYGIDLPPGYELEVYATWLIKKSGVHLIRFPVHYGARKHGSSKWNMNLVSQMKMTVHISKFVGAKMLK